MWSSYVHPVIWEDHCFVGCSAVWSGREAPLHTSVPPSFSALLEANVSVKYCCFFYQTARRHIQEYSNVDERVTSHKMQEASFPLNMSST